MSPADADPADEVDGLRRRVEALERENAYLRAVQRIEGRLGLLVGQFALLVVAGRGLTFGVRNWLRTFHRTGRVSVPASAEVLAAVIRTAFSIGLLGLLVTAVPIGLLWRQNDLIAEQNAYFQEQNDKIQLQLANEERNTRVVRRAALLSTLYDTGPCREPPCAPVADIRSRSEALLAFVQFERAYGVPRPDVSRANLDGAGLGGADLRGLKLDRASLRRAELRRADLSDTGLADADLRGASLAGAALRRAELGGARLLEVRANEAADFTEARLDGADLRDAWLRTAVFDRASLVGARFAGSDVLHASLRGAALAGADLRDARNLDAAELTDATYDGETRWPEGFDPGARGARRE